MSRARVGRAWRRALPWVAFIAWGLGVASFLPLPAGAHGVEAILQILFGEDLRRSALKSLQLFVLNVPPAEIGLALDRVGVAPVAGSEAAGWLRGLAGWLAAGLAPAATAGAAIYAFGERAWQALQLARLRRTPADDVFVGGGETAAGVAARRARMLARAAAAGRARGKLVGVDLRADAPLARAMQDFGTAGFVHAGDVLAEGGLRPLQIHRAGNVWILTGDDHRNLEVAQRVRAAIEAAHRGHGHRPVRVLVELRDRRLLRAAGALSDGLDARRLSLEFFSLPRLAARTLLREHPPRPGPGAQAPHLLVVGASDLAAALVVHAAQHCVHQEDPAQCVRITLVGQGSRGLHQRLLQAFPALALDSPDPMLAALLPLARITSQDCDETELAHAQWLELQQAQPFDAVYVACGRDLSTLAAAARMAALREITAGTSAQAQPIVACLQQPAGSVCAQAAAAGAPGGAGPAPGIAPGLCDAAGAGPGAPVLLFDLHERCIREDESYPGERQDGRATIVHAAHAWQAAAPFEASVEAVRQAAELWAQARQEDFRWSDRLAADHVDLKLDRLALACADPVLQDWRTMLAADPSRLAGAVREVLRNEPGIRMALARLEHRRFVAERLLEGWLPLPAGLRGRGASGLPEPLQKSVLRLSHTLVPFDRLPEADPDTDQQAKDLRLVDAIPEILEGEAKLG
ncbi:MAG TPA: hypothetical protein VN324_14900 [Quisquiliibacterium sp.]|nr:hypothetical protein [Quisquiliibacterium sp.]